MMYLTKLAEEIREYKVVRYLDHFLDTESVRYFDDWDKAYSYYKDTLYTLSRANYTMSLAIINVKTGMPIHKETWRI